MTSLRKEIKTQQERAEFQCQAINMVLQFYWYPGSLPCKAVWSILETLNIEYEKKFVDIIKGDQKNPDYLATNPDGKIPFIVDNEFGLGESRAIMCYLCSKYEGDQKADKLYPADLQLKGKIDKALYQDFQYTTNMVEYTNLAGVLYRGDGTGIVEERWPGVEDMLEGLERRLNATKYMAADHITVADYSALATVAGFDHFIPDDAKLKYPKLLEWKKHMQSLPMYETVYGDSPLQFKQFYDSIVKERAKK